MIKTTTTFQCDRCLTAAQPAGTGITPRPPAGWYRLPVEIVGGSYGRCIDLCPSCGPLIIAACGGSACPAWRSGPTLVAVEDEP